MSTLIQHYPLACLMAAFIAGGSFGFLGLALCVAAREGAARPASNPAAPQAPETATLGNDRTPSVITPAAAAGSTFAEAP